MSVRNSTTKSRPVCPCCQRKLSARQSGDWCHAGTLLRPMPVTILGQRWTIRYGEGLPAGGHYDEATRTIYTGTEFMPQTVAILVAGAVESEMRRQNIVQTLKVAALLGAKPTPEYAAYLQ